MLTNNQTFTSFSVNDAARARAFYGDTLGLTVGYMQGVLQVQTGDGHDVMVYPKEDHQPATYTVLNFQVKDIEKAVDDLNAKGVKMEQYSGDIQTDEKGINRGAMGAIAWFKDPAGNILSLVEMPST